MKEYKIKFKLVKFEKALVFQVLEMDKRFRCENGHILKFKSKNGIEIISNGTPAINRINEVYLRCNFTDYDFYITSTTFDSNSERDEYYNKVLEALKDWSENWEGFKDNSKQEIKSEDNDVFAF